ncbi:unnamed protein product [Dicrocoelium dendriticum]|nr:unnamed protein product [Dicrocoelium dendriticum]
MELASEDIAALDCSSAHVFIWDHFVFHWLTNNFYHLFYWQAYSVLFTAKHNEKFSGKFCLRVIRIALTAVDAR